MSLKKLFLYLLVFFAIQITLSKLSSLRPATNTNIQAKVFKVIFPRTSWQIFLTQSNSLGHYRDISYLFWYNYIYIVKFPLNCFPLNPFFPQFSIKPLFNFTGLVIILRSTNLVRKRQPSTSLLNRALWIFPVSIFLLFIDFLERLERCFQVFSPVFAYVSNL